MDTALISVILVIVVALLFDFVNGWNDSANAIATVVSTRVLAPLVAGPGSGRRVLLDLGDCSSSVSFA